MILDVVYWIFKRDEPPSNKGSKKGTNEEGKRREVGSREEKKRRQERTVGIKE